RGQLIGSAFGAAIAGALFGPVLGAVAAFTGTAAAFGAVAGLALVLAFFAWRTPAATPAEPQPVRMLFRALNVRSIQVPIWLCVLPALLFGNLSVLAPLRLSHLGWGAAAIGGAYLLLAASESLWAPTLGPRADHFGRMPPLRAALVAAAVVSFLLPWPQRPWLLALVIVSAGFAYGSFWTPAMSMVTDEAETFGLDYGYAFALINIAWAPGQAGGAALGGLPAAAPGDAVPSLFLSALCLLTLGAISGYGSSAEPLAAER